MINKFLKMTAVTAVATIAFTSCGNRVKLMKSSTEADADTISNASYIEIENYQQQDTDESETTTEQEATTETTTIDIYQKDYDLPTSAVIDGFETVMQNPELPTGCEITALTQTLNFLGFDVDKVTMCDKYMLIDMNGEYTMDECYIGDPKSYTGFGCNSPVICKAARRLFRVEKSDCYPVDLTGTDFKDLFYQVEQGRPVVVWATMYLMDTKPEYVYTAKNGNEMWFCTYQHCLTLYGYDLDKGIVYVADPLVGNTTYPIEKFEEMYNILGKQAVIICGDAKDGLNAEPKSVTRSEPEITTESGTEEITITETEFITEDFITTDTETEIQSDTEEITEEEKEEDTEISEETATYEESED